MNLKTMDKWPDLSNMKLEEAHAETQPKRESRSDGGQAKAVHFRHVAFSDDAMTISNTERKIFHVGSDSPLPPLLVIALMTLKAE